MKITKLLLAALVALSMTGCAYQNQCGMKGTCRTDPQGFTQTVVVDLGSRALDTATTIVIYNAVN